MRLLVLALAGGAAAFAPPPQPTAAECDALEAEGAFLPVVISNSRGLQLHVLPYGATVQRLLVPARDGGLIDIVQGHDAPRAYCRNDYGGAGGTHPYYGALIGRVANRIANCSFVLNGTTFATPCNEESAATGRPDTLHGGPVGFDRRVWRVARAPAGDALTLSLDSADGEMGFPSDLSISVTYALTEPAPGAAGGFGGWDIQYRAVNVGAAATLASLTQHTYWMLSGFSGGEETVLAHVLAMPRAATFQAVDAGLIPTGEVRSVAGFMDFRSPRAVGSAFVNGSLPDGASGCACAAPREPPGAG
jgi:aldose 1-epimerase